MAGSHLFSDRFSHCAESLPSGVRLIFFWCLSMLFGLPKTLSCGKVSWKIPLLWAIWLTYNFMNLLRSSLLLLLHLFSRHLTGYHHLGGWKLMLMVLFVMLRKQGVLVWFFVTKPVAMLEVSFAKYLTPPLPSWLKFLLLKRAFAGHSNTTGRILSWKVMLSRWFKHLVPYMGVPRRLTCWLKIFKLVWELWLFQGLSHPSIHQCCGTPNG